jgi:hemerythrin-like domain-containing protein
MAKKTRSEGVIPAAHAHSALEILKNFADRCHHGKEEDILFPALEAAAPGFGPTQVMRHEHVEGRGYIKGMTDALAGADSLGFALNAENYAELLEQHIGKEDGILFPMAANLLDDETDARLLEAYRKIEHEDMGNGTHERLLGMADELAGIYGVPRASADPKIMALLTAVCGCHV